MEESNFEIELVLWCFEFILFENPQLECVESLPIYLISLSYSSWWEKKNEKRNNGLVE